MKCKLCDSNPDLPKETLLPGKARNPAFLQLLVLVIAGTTANPHCLLQPAPRVSEVQTHSLQQALGMCELLGIILHLGFAHVEFVAFGERLSGGKGGHTRLEQGKMQSAARLFSLTM